jgi:hypothetical protein
MMFAPGNNGQRDHVRQGQSWATGHGLVKTTHGHAAAGVRPNVLGLYSWLGNRPVGQGRGVKIPAGRHEWQPIQVSKLLAP